jgi:hypothetical protein
MSIFQELIYQRGHFADENTGGGKCTKESAASGMFKVPKAALRGNVNRFTVLRGTWSLPDYLPECVPGNYRPAG